MIRDRSQFAFTLIEIMVVLLIAALLATAVMASLFGVRQRIQAQNAIEEVELFDRLTRLETQKLGQSEQIVIDLGRNELSRVDRATQQVRGTPYTLPASVKIDRALVGNQRADFGQITLICNEHGLTPSYALHLLGPKNESRWLVFAGLSGQGVVVANDDQLAKTWAIFEPSSK